eukprot:6464269-Amphidinium_carterae.2
MVCRAKSAVTGKKPALQSRRLKTDTRLGIYNCYARCHLLQNIVVLQPFSANELKRIRAEYYRGIRLSTEQVVTHAGVKKLSNAGIRARYKVQDVATLMEKRVLMFFIKMAVVDNELVRAALSASFAHDTMWTRLFAALNKLRAAVPGNLTHLPAASPDSIDAWSQFVVGDIAGWKLMVRKYEGAADDAQDENADPEHVHVEASAELETAPETDGLAEGLAAILEEEEALLCFSCEDCSYKGKSNAALQAHRRRAHQAFSDLSARVRTATCDGCDLNFGLRTRVLDHFRQSPRCAAWVRANIEPMSPRTFEQVRLATNGQDESQSRLLVPKPGRKPKGIKPPTCAYAPKFADGAQLLASQS